MPYKRVDLVVEAFNRLRLPLKVVGDGPERARLEQLAGPTVQILGRQSQEQVETLLARCRAFVYAGLEDFGIAPVEAMASGAPVIGLGRGGLLDSVRCAAAGSAEPTGVLFPEQTPASVAQAVDWFEQRRLWRSCHLSSCANGPSASGRTPLCRALRHWCNAVGKPISNPVPLPRVPRRATGIEPLRLSRLRRMGDRMVKAPRRLVFPASGATQDARPAAAISLCWLHRPPR